MTPAPALVPSGGPGAPRAGLSAELHPLLPMPGSPGGAGGAGLPARQDARPPRSERGAARGQRWTQQRPWNLESSRRAAGSLALGANPFWDTSRLLSAVTSASCHWGHTRHSCSARSSAMPGLPFAKVTSPAARPGSQPWTRGTATPAAAPPGRPSLTGGTSAARSWATRCRRSFLAVVTASTCPSRCFRLADRGGGPGTPPALASAALAPGSRTSRAAAAAAAVAVAAASRGRLAFDGRSVLSLPTSCPAPTVPQSSTPLPLGLSVSGATRSLLARTPEIRSSADY